MSTKKTKRKQQAKWITVVDFTKIRKGGVPFEEVLKVLEEIKYIKSPLVKGGLGGLN